MKRSVLLLAALFAVFSVQADNRPQAVLKQLTAALGALEGYSVVFEVHTDGDVVPGYYEVSGDNYYMHVNGQEVYGDAEFRYEIDPDRKEVVIDRVDLTSHNLLNNPTRAFDFIDGEYAASLLSEKGSTAVIRLTPLRIQSAVPSIVRIQPQFSGKGILGHSPKRVLVWGPRRDARPAGERRSGGALEGCLSHRDSDPTWSKARDDAHE